MQFGLRSTDGRVRMSTGLPNRSESSAAMLNKAQSRRLPRFEFDQEVDIALGSEVVSERRAEDGKTCNSVGTAEFSQAVSWKQYVLVHAVGSCRCVSMFRQPDFISSEVGERGFVQGVLPQSACACPGFVRVWRALGFLCRKSVCTKGHRKSGLFVQSRPPGGLKFVEKVLQ